MKISRARLKEIIIEVLNEVKPAVSLRGFDEPDPVRLRGWWGSDLDVIDRSIDDQPSPINPFTVPPPKGQISLDIDPIKKGDFVVLNHHILKDVSPETYGKYVKRFRGVEGRVLSVTNLLTKTDPDWRVRVEFFFRSPTADKFIVKELGVRLHQIDRVKPKKTGSMDTLPIWRPS